MASAMNDKSVGVEDMEDLSGKRNTDCWKRDEITHFLKVFRIRKAESQTRRWRLVILGL